MSRFLARFTRRAAVRNAEHGEPHGASDGIMNGASDGVMGGALNGAAHGASIGDQRDPSHGYAIAEADDYIDGAPYDYLRLRITQFKPKPFPRTDISSNSTVRGYDGENGYRNPTAKESAEEFYAWIRQQPQFVGNWVRACEIRDDLYPEFCRSVGWPRAPHIKFAHELGLLTRRRQRERRGPDFRHTWVEYYISPPV